MREKSYGGTAVQENTKVKGKSKVREVQDYQNTHCSISSLIKALRSLIWKGEKNPAGLGAEI
jgi:hypothetical protein